MTLAEINRMIRAAIRAARQEGAHEVEVTIAGEATVRIPLAPASVELSAKNELDRELEEFEKRANGQA
jgi:hypothetical protein